MEKPLVRFASSECNVTIYHPNPPTSDRGPQNLWYQRSDLKKFQKDACIDFRTLLHELSQSESNGLSDGSHQYKSHQCSFPEGENYFNSFHSRGLEKLFNIERQKKKCFTNKAVIAAQKIMKEANHNKMDNFDLSLQLAKIYSNLSSWATEIAKKESQCDIFVQKTICPVVCHRNITWRPATKSCFLVNSAINSQHKTNLLSRKRNYDVFAPFAEDDEASRPSKILPQRNSCNSFN